MTLMFLNGGAMRGGPLNHLLQGAPLVGVVRTAPKYRFYSVGDTFPAIDPVASGGTSVIGELYDVPWDVLERSLLPAEPEELELGVIELEDGRGALSMVRRRAYTEPHTYRDISHHADWRAYKASLEAAQ
jgi:gamma-glutamylcyclotransferase (GGCT)/AIG2-like uncharacterized protein YtfP